MMYVVEKTRKNGKMNDLEEETLKIVVEQKINDNLDKHFPSFACDDMDLYYNNVYGKFDIKFTNAKMEDMDFSSFKEKFCQAFHTCKITEFHIEAEDNHLNIYIDFALSPEEEDRLIKNCIPTYKGEPLEHFCAVQVVELWLEWAWNPKSKRYEIFGFHSFEVDERSPKKKLLIPEKILGYRVGNDYPSHLYFPERRFIDLTEKNNLLKKPIYKKIDSIMGYFGLACKLSDITEKDC